MIRNNPVSSAFNPALNIPPHVLGALVSWWLGHQALHRVIGRRSLLALVLLLAQLAPALPAAAQQAPAPGADIVFVVDQSGSMSKGTIINSSDRRCKPERLPDCPRTAPTDPDGLAIRTVHDGLAPIFERLVLRSLAGSAAGGPAEDYRFGLVLFGGDDDPAASVVTGVPLTRIEIERGARGRLAPNLARMLPSETINLGETAFSRAFRAVCEMLECEVAAPPGRTRVVVLLTDGQPSLDEFAYDPARPDGYFSALRKEHAALFAGAQIWVLGLDQANRFWPKNEPYWSQIAPGRTFRLSAPSDIADRLRAIARATIGEPPGAQRTCDGAPFAVEPYRSTLTLSLEYADPQGRATIALPDGAPLSERTPNLLSYSRSAQSETFIIAQPTPGSWRCTLAGSGVNPRLRTLMGSFVLADVSFAPAEGALVSACRDFKLELGYADASGQPLAELADYPLKHELWLSNGGTTALYQLQPVGSGRDRWATGQALRPDPRDSLIEARVDVRLPSGAPVFSATRQLNMIDAALPCIAPGAPAAGSVSQIYAGLSLTDLELSVTLSQRGSPSTPAGVFREDMAQIVSGRLEGPGGLSRSFALQPRAGAAGVFAAQLPGIEASGVYTFTATLQGTTQANQPYSISTAPIAFTRVADPIWVAARWAVWLATVLALLIVVTLLIVVAIMLSGPFPRGTLVLEQRAGAPDDAYNWQRVASVALSSQRVLGLFRTRRVRVRPRTLRGTGLRELKVRRIVRGKSEGVQVTVLRDQKRANLSFQFMKHQEYKTFDGKFRIVYEVER